MLLYEEIWDNTALYCQPVFFQSWKGIRLILVKCEGSYLFLSCRKTDPGHMASRKCLLCLDKNYTLQTFPITALKWLVFFNSLAQSVVQESVQRGANICSGSTIIRGEESRAVSGISFGAHNTGQAQCCSALHAPSPSNFSTALTQLCLIFGKVWEYIFC